MTVRGFSNISELKALENNDIVFIVPFDRNPNFTGRKSQLAKLEEKFFEQGQTTKVAVTGLGGVGKTQVTLEFVYQMKDKHPNCSVIWIPATNLESLYQAYQDVAGQLCIPGWEEEKADVMRLVQSHLSKESSGQWLLVFDNSDDSELWFARTAEQGGSRLVEYLPRSKHGCILFTTRDRKMAVQLAQKNVVDIPEMDEDAAIHLLQNSLISPDLVHQISDTIALLKELTFLPLAIVQAAAYINENRVAFSEYLSLLRDQEEEVIELLSEEFEVERRYHDVKNPVATTWLISFEKIRRRDPLAADYLSFMACVNPKNIPRSLLPAGPSRKKEIDAIGTLDAYSFVTKQSNGLALDIHRLVHLATRNWLRKQELIVQWSEKAITQLEEVFPDKEHKNRGIWRTYLPHVQYVLSSDVVDQEGTDRMRLGWRYGNCLESDGRYAEAEVQFFEALEVDKRVLGQDHPSTLASMASLASIYWNQGRWKEAEELEVLVIETMKRVSGQEHPETLASIGNLASTYSNQGRWKEAEELEVLVTETMKRVLGQEHPHTLSSMNNLASIYWNQGRLKEAEELGVLVIEMRKRVLGQEHLDTLTSMNNLATTYWNQGRLKEAEELGVLVIEMRKRMLGQEHPHTLTSMNNLATTYLDQGRWKEAEELELLVIEIRKRVLGQEHPETLTSMASLAVTWKQLDRLEEAEELGVLVMEMRKRLLGQKHQDTLTSMANLAITWKQLDRLQEASRLLEECATLEGQILGVEHPETLSSTTILSAWRAET